MVEHNPTIHRHPYFSTPYIYLMSCSCRRYKGGKFADDMGAWSAWWDHAQAMRKNETAAPINAPAPAKVECGKESYDSERVATRALLEIWHAYPNDPIRREIRTYECDVCQPVRWHLTSRPSAVGT